jgi:predicted transcriptional regulator
MTRLLEQAVEAVRVLPDDVQDDLARMLRQLAGVEQPPYQLTPQEAADIDVSLAEADRGEFATDEESPGHVGKAWPVKVRYTRRAIRQLTNILDYIEARSPQGA